MIKKKYSLSIYSLLLLILFGFGCSSNEKDKNLIEAFELHKEAIRVRGDVGDKVEMLNANTDSVFVETYKSELESVNLLLAEWDAQLIEVPGFDEEHDHDHEGHDHDHDHDHNHNHNHAGDDLTPEQHLEIQKHLLQEIKTLSERVNQIQG